MILQILADIRQVVHHWNPAVAQQFAGADARQLQELRRLDRAAGEDDTGSPEAVARPRFPQNVACRFPALRSSEDDSQHCESL